MAKKYGVLNKITNFFQNWDCDENAKLEISVKDMREICSMFTTKCRAESKLKALKQSSCEDKMREGDKMTRESMIKVLRYKADHIKAKIKPKFFAEVADVLEKESKTGHCKDCKYFEYDHFENMGGIPLITAHKVCKCHGLICKTDEDGYCHLWEHKAESEES